MIFLSCCQAEDAPARFAVGDIPLLAKAEEHYA